jgi:glycosyltransferase involved in cell wall biosynthesis
MKTTFHSYNMKKLIILSHYYFPNAFIASHRMAKLAKYLPEYGWEPNVICSDWTRNNCDMFDPNLMTAQMNATLLHRTQRRKRSKSRLPQFIYDVFFSLRKPHILFQAGLCKYMPRYYFTTPPEFYCGALSFLNEHLSMHRLHCILATSPPPAALSVAGTISKRFRIPWVADFRDTYDIRMQVKNETRRQALLRQEPEVIKSCTAILTVSEGLQKHLQERHGRTVRVLHNGYDPEDYETTPPHKPSVFNIVYTGSIYYPDRDPRPLFGALKKLLDNGNVISDEFSLEFFGTKNQDLKHLIDGFPGIERCVRVHGAIPHRASIARQKGAHVLLHLAHGSEKGILTGKLFEYLAAKRPILCIPGDKDCVEETLRRTKSGIVCEQQEAVEEQVLSWYREWKATGKVSYSGISAEIIKYSRRQQASELATILNDCV